MSETDSKSSVFSAKELRQHMAELEFQRVEKMQRKRQAAEQALAEFVEHFTKENLSEKEVEQVRMKARNAAEQGETEVMVVRFPSSLCSDQGRAINNGDANWPETLPKKAHQFFELWQSQGKDLGFSLKALIVDFPDGMPGDVGLFIGWGE